MRKFLVRFFIGFSPQKNNLPFDAIGNHIQILNKVWEGQDYNDFGLERIFRLFLLAAKLFFPGIYLEQLFGKINISSHKIWTECYVLIKTLLPFTILYFEATQNHLLFFLNAYLLFETFIYIFSRIYLSEHFNAEDYKRMLILLFLNFLEVVFSFAVIYSSGKHLNKPFSGYVDAIYFSMMTSSTVAYGDFYPVTYFGKITSILQAVSTLVFLVLFFNFFNSKVKD